MRSKLFSAVICLAACGLLGSAAHAEVCDDIGISTNTTLERLTIADLPAGERPLLVTAPPGDTSRIFIVAQDGIIWVKQIGSALTTQSVYMDIDDRVNSVGDERGLLGLAFDPNFATNSLFYVNYTNASGDTLVSRFIESGGVGDATSERRLLFIDQTESNHNGGQIMFGPDDMLYVFTGDGGGGGDEHGNPGGCGNGQNIDTLNIGIGLNPLLGKILRVDPNHSGPTEADCGTGQLPYGIPAGNPFVGQTGCDEIYAYGLRNPWRNDFDDLTGDLYVADVGQGCWEEVTYIPAGTGAGANLGWRQMEGTHCYNPGQGCFAVSAANCSPACNDPSLTDPVYDYRRSGGNCSVTGGVVYRGCRMANLQATYFYADYCVAQTLSFEVVGGNDTNHINWTARKRRASRSSGMRRSPRGWPSKLSTTRES